MDYQMENRTPRDRLGNEMLRRVLNDDYSCQTHCHTNIRCAGNNNYKANRVGTCIQTSQNARPIGMVYAQVQVWGDMYDPCEALKRGTMFRELDLPFLMYNCGSQKGGCCR